MEGYEVEVEVKNIILIFKWMIGGKTIESQ